MSADPGHIDALKIGDEQAWVRAFHDLWPLALRAAQHPELFLTLEEAQDAASEALVQVVEQIERVQTFEQVKALAVTIAYRRAVSLARRKSASKRKPKIPALGLQEQDCDEKDNPDCMSSCLTDLDIRELVVLLKEALAALEEETRTLLNEKIGQGLTYEELSRKHQMPVGTLCAKVARGLRKVRHALHGLPALVKELEAFLR
jgi:RNA polymerase sigma-70 factor (ECF subfamily)